MLSNPQQSMKTGSILLKVLILISLVIPLISHANEQEKLYADDHWRDGEVRDFMLQNLNTLIQEKYSTEPDLALRAMLMSIKLVDTIKDDETQAHGYLFIGSQTPFKQHREPLLNKALESAMRMHNTHNKDWILEFIAAEQSVTNFETALNTIDKMTDEHVKPSGLVKIAHKQQKNREQQLRALTIAVDVAENFEPEFKIDAFIIIASHFRHSNYIDKADKLRDRRRKLERAIQETKEQNLANEKIK